MEPNLSILEIVIRYIAMLLLGILGGVLQSFVIIILALLVFLTAITGFDPVYKLLKINHSNH